MYFLAIFLPPVAVLLCRKPGQAILNFLLIFLLWVPAVFHAWSIVSDYKADKRNNKLIKAIEKSGKHEVKN